MRSSHESLVAVALFVLSCIGVQAFAPVTRAFGRGITPLATSATAAADVREERKQGSALSDFDYHKNNKLPWLPQGYNTWIWRDHRINWVDLGGDDSKPPLLLIHGFGASVYHWRYNIPTLARDYHVFALDMLGFGLSDKPILDYSAELWRDQTIDFIREVIVKSRPRATTSKVVVAGNSLGGFTALYAGSDSVSRGLDLVSGVVLLNAAGRFKPTEPEEPKQEYPQFIQDIIAGFQRIVIGASFYYTKQPQRIEQVLRQVYPVDATNVDAELVDSIQFPAQHPNAPEVFYRVIAKNGNGPPKFIDDLLEGLGSLPLLLLWGEQDPWIRPRAADAIQTLYPNAIRASVNGGHCPHDECPADVNREMKKFVDAVNGLA
jgi:pimeloyl-ACP methyl ester carboxylesterase